MRLSSQAVLGTLSVVAVVGAAISGVYSGRAAEIMTPVVALVAILANSAQGISARAHDSADAAARRRLEAYARLLRAFRTITNKAESILRSVDNHTGTPSDLPTVWYWRDTVAAIDDFHACAELLRLLADPAAVRIIDAVLNKLDGLDAQSTRNQDAGVHPTEDVEDLRTFVEVVAPHYRDLVAHARAHVIS